MVRQISLYEKNGAILRWWNLNVSCFSIEELMFKMKCFYMNETSRETTSAIIYMNRWHIPTHTRTHVPTPTRPTYPSTNPWKGVDYSGTWRDVLCHLQTHPHELKMSGWATFALSSASGSCQHILTSPGGIQLGLTACRARGPPGFYSCYLSLSLSNTHKYKNTHTHLHINT